jgi:anthranilate phosphoribosyltransferase
MIKECIQNLVEFQNLTQEETKEVFDEIMKGEATASQIASFITALRMKGETIDEITGAAISMRSYCYRVDIGSNIILDTCGTGGGKSHTFNISTAVAFVCAGCGIYVAKHGNRAITSRCGSADVLEALGMNIQTPVEKAAECLKNIGICFLFAPLYHPAMRFAMPSRREVGIRTIFNILGPISNPAGANAHLMGVYDKSLTSVMAMVLKNLQTKRAYVVNGIDDGVDEVSIVGRTQVSELKDGEVSTYTITPEQLGINRCGMEDMQGIDALTCANIIKSILSGEKGPKTDVVVANSIFAILAAGKAQDIKEAKKIAIDSIDSGRAGEKLNKLIQFTKENM